MSKTCPSSRCEEGALLLGTVREDGTIAGPCVAQQCGQWTAGKCGVPGAVAKLLAEFEHDRKAAPEHCAIRPTCRWFAQESYAACALCPLVTTERETAAI
jgi:hypothetical protein